jgi:hypothetical protein
MNEEKLTKYISVLQDEVSVKIVNFTRTPKTTDEIITQIWDYLRNRYSSIYNERLKASTVIAAKLGNLEALGAIEYTEGKWETTPEFIEILAKYFGL